MVMKIITETEKGELQVSQKTEQLKLLAKQNSKLLNLEATLLGINCQSELNESSSLFFGIGGGTHKGLSQGLPFDILAMILCGQKIKQELNLGRSYIFLANKTTQTNGFSQENIDKLMKGEKELLEIVLSGMGIQKDWIVFLETEMKDTLGQKIELEYQKIIADARKILSTRGEYFCRETAATIVLAQNGIKLGWCANGTGGDERDFDQKTDNYLQKRQVSNKISYAYTIPGIRIVPGVVESAVPYIVHHPLKRILLHPDENSVEKIESGGGLWSRNSRRLFGGIVQTFEEIILERRIQEEKTEQKVASVLEYVFEGQEDGARDIWESTFLNPQKGSVFNNTPLFLLAKH